MRIKDDPKLVVTWLKRGTKFSSRCHGQQFNKTNRAVLVIRSFQSEDLGIYICKVKQSEVVDLKHNIFGERKYYLMASEFGIERNEQLLFNPDIELKVLCNLNNCIKLDSNKMIQISCDVKNFG